MSVGVKNIIINGEGQDDTPVRINSGRLYGCCIEIILEDGRALLMTDYGSGLQLRMKQSPALRSADGGFIKSLEQPTKTALTVTTTVSETQHTGTVTIK